MSNEPKLAKINRAFDRVQATIIDIRSDLGVGDIDAIRSYIERAHRQLEMLDTEVLYTELGGV